MRINVWDFLLTWHHETSHGVSWLCHIFWVWRQSYRHGTIPDISAYSVKPTPWSKLRIVFKLRSFSYFSEWRKISKFGDVTTCDVGFTAKLRPKNGPILMKIGIHIDQTSDYYHAKFYQNWTNLKEIIIFQSCPILIKFCVVIVKSLVYMYTNFCQNRTIFWLSFCRESQTRGMPSPKFWYFLLLIDS